MHTLYPTLHPVLRFLSSFTHTPTHIHTKSKTNTRTNMLTVFFSLTYNCSLLHTIRHSLLLPHLQRVSTHQQFLFINLPHSLHNTILLLLHKPHRHTGTLPPSLPPSSSLRILDHSYSPSLPSSLPPGDFLIGFVGNSKMKHI